MMHLGEANIPLGEQSLKVFLRALLRVGADSIVVGKLRCPQLTPRSVPISFYFLDSLGRLQLAWRTLPSRAMSRINQSRIPRRSLNSSCVRTRTSIGKPG